MLKYGMRSCIHTAVTLLAVVALITPFDCFTSGVRTREAAACCIKGECHPGADADDCCKNTVRDGSLLLVPTASSHDVLFGMTIVANSATLVLAPVFMRLTNELRHPPRKPSSATVNLPLLI